MYVIQLHKHIDIWDHGTYDKLMINANTTWQAVTDLSSTHTDLLDNVRFHHYHCSLHCWDCVKYNRWIYTSFSFYWHYRIITMNNSWLMLYKTLNTKQALSILAWMNLVNKRCGMTLTYFNEHCQDVQLIFFCKFWLIFMVFDICMVYR